jgi:ABC-type transport system involved in multi-copper enzyme maturation permease subunit
LIVGPVLSREVTTSPRNWRLYFSRALYVAALFSLAITAWLILIGSQPVRTLGDIARFGAFTFSLLAPVQLALAMAFSALLTAAAVAQEKDRRTIDLMLMTRLTNSELVLGRLAASMLSVLVLIVAAIPLWMLLALLGGVSYLQIARVVGVTLTAAIAAGSLGSTLALWREKTFQTLALTALSLVLWVVLGEAIFPWVGAGTWGGASADDWAALVSPLRAILAAAEPVTASNPLFAGAAFRGDSVVGFMLVSAAGAVLLNVAAIARVRVWNPSQEARPGTAEEAARRGGETVGRLRSAGTSDDIHAAPGRSRRVWDNPILWREICTWAYGKKILLVRVAYLLMFAACAAAVVGLMSTSPASGGAAMPPLARPMIPLAILGLILVNALAVTSLTNERDLKALDLLLVTDLTPREIIYGKLAGVFYNSKEIILLPLGLCVLLWWSQRLSGENLLFLIVGQLVMTGFVAMLGIHSGMTYANSRTAVGVSLGTVLFLLLGIAVCMRMMMAFQTSFYNQLQAFAAFIVGGSVGLYCALGSHRGSGALALASFVAPLATFFVLTSFLLGNYGAAFLVTVTAYGFATAAMLVPAVHEFDVATGRTAARDL